MKQHTLDLQGQDTVPITSVLGAWKGGTGIFLKSAGFPETGMDTHLNSVSTDRGGGAKELPAEKIQTLACSLPAVFGNDPGS